MLSVIQGVLVATPLCEMHTCSFPFSFTRKTPLRARCSEGRSLALGHSDFNSVKLFRNVWLDITQHANCASEEPGGVQCTLLSRAVTSHRTLTRGAKHA